MRTAATAQTAWHRTLPGRTAGNDAAAAAGDDADEYVWLLPSWSSLSLWSFVSSSLLSQCLRLLSSAASGLEAVALAVAGDDAAMMPTRTSSLPMCCRSNAAAAAAGDVAAVAAAAAAVAVQNVADPRRPFSRDAV